MKGSQAESSGYVTRAELYERLRPLRACLWDFNPDEDRAIWCKRPALPGRWLCHKHAGMRNRLERRRARNRVGRKQRAAQ